MAQPVMDPKTMSLYLGEDLARDLRIEASYHGMSRSEFCRKILESAVKRSKAQRKGT